MAKIRGPDGCVLHRMGDLGRIDDEGRLWILGRKAHRLETEHGTLYPVPLENAFERLTGVHRTALVGVGHDAAAHLQHPVLRVIGGDAQVAGERGPVVEVDRLAEPARAPGRDGAGGVPGLAGPGCAASRRRPAPCRASC